MDAVGRLRVWIAEYGDEKQPQFIADLEAVLDQNELLREAAQIFRDLGEFDHLHEQHDLGLVRRARITMQEDKLARES